MSFKEREKSMNILIVDDSIAVRNFIKKIFKQWENMHIFEAEDGQKALEICRSMPQDVILVDWNMPIMNGLTFLEHHVYEKLKGMVIFCTSMNEKHSIQTALDKGAREYIMKPFDAAILHDKLQQLGIFPR
jgi:two-component system chemotaxis response regulator CheY